MKSYVPAAVSVLAALTAPAEASPYDTRALQTLQKLAARALPANSPHGYTPQTGDCPSTKPTIRSASTLSSQEQSWLSTRRNATVDPMKTLLSRMNISGLDTDSYIDKYKNEPLNLPNIGIAVSGGGYRAMLNAAGVVEAFDSRTTNSTAKGQLGGLLQASTYLAGLSGGNWMVGSLYSNNFSSVDSILARDTSSSNSGGLWQFGNSIFEGPSSSGLQIFDTGEYYGQLISDVHDKSDAGFNTSITDYWGRSLSYQLVNATEGGPAFTFSSIADQSWFTSGSAPLPFLVTDGRLPGQIIASSNSTIYTFSPWELGSEDPTVYGFAPLKYVGTNFSDGSTVSDQCVTGYDNVGFVMGTSSSLFNEAFVEVNGTSTSGLVSSALKTAIEAVLSAVGKANEDIADYPNPFYQWRPDANPSASKHSLSLVDGGEDLQNIPLHPLIQPNRNVDVIFAVDSSADTNASFPTNHSAENWPAGISLVATYQRSLYPISNGTAFPAIPDENTFFNLGLNNRPTFFGCDAKNSSGPTPLIVYLPNAPYVYTSNTSTFDLQYEDSQRNALILNGYNLATQGNSSAKLDSQWDTCVGCAILSRSLHRTGTDVPEVCKSCFSRYCWNGTVDSSQPGNYVPQIKLKAEEVQTGSSSSKKSGALSALPGGKEIVKILGVAGAVGTWMGI